MFQYSSLVLILATDALRPLRSQSCSVVCYKATDPQLKDQFAEFLLALPHVFLFRFCPSSTSQPNGFSCDAFISSSLLVTLCSGETALTVTRPSNRDCACLRLSRGCQVGSYPSWANQPSILACCRMPIGKICHEGRGKQAVSGCHSPVEV